MARLSDLTRVTDTVADPVSTHPSALAAASQTRATDFEDDAAIDVVAAVQNVRLSTPQVPEPGASAPRFLLADGPSTRLGVADFAGRWVVIAFHVADWEPVAESQLRSLSDLAADLRHRGIDVVSVSSDTIWSHAAFARAAGISIPLLADDDPPGAVSTAYGTGSGRGARAVFLVDPAGRVRWSQLVDPRVDPGVDGLLSAVERLLAPVQPAAEDGSAG